MLSHDHGKPQACRPPSSGAAVGRSHELRRPPDAEAVSTFVDGSGILPRCPSQPGVRDASAHSDARSETELITLKWPRRFIRLLYLTELEGAAGRRRLRRIEFWGLHGCNKGVIIRVRLLSVSDCLGRPADNFVYCVQSFQGSFGPLRI